MKAKKWIMSILGGIVLLAGVIYLGGVFYFNNHFLFGTEVSGERVDQVSLNEAADKIDHNLKERQVNVKENGQAVGSLKLADYVSLPSGSEVVKIAKAAQNSWAWPVELFDQSKLKLQSVALKGDVGEDASNQAFKALKIDNDQREKSQDAEIQATADKKDYEIKAEKVGNQVDQSQFISLLNTAINKSKDAIDLKDAYIQPRVKANDTSFKTMVTRLDQLAKDPLTMTVGTQKVEIPTERVRQWLTVNDQDKITVDQNAVDKYLAQWNQENAGLWTSHSFNSTLSGQVTVQPGTYGWYLSEPKTSEAMVQALNNNEHQVTATVVGKGSDQDNFFGHTYVEVDISKQKMLIYQNGNQVFSTDVATGADVTKTVPGAYQVWNKESPSVLVGTNGYTGEAYRTPVSYWLAFDDRGQGIHDASWQPKFGGDWYHEHGSNGCVNVSPDVMGQVFSLIEVGTPVIVF
ncbi:MAG: L,D-transpeptidase family protein [Aerococcus sp.]|nr:L,D-transpeptidase family protein [Aerococcus sp.]